METISISRGYWIAGGATAVVLFVFAVFYDRLVGSLEREGHDRGYMGFIVAIGSAVTITGACVPLVIWLGWWVGLVVWLTVMAAFVASGTPMILGSVRRHLQRRMDNTQTWLGFVNCMVEGEADDEAADREDELAAGDLPSPTR